MHTLIVITLDWTRPSTFIDQLRTWLAWVDKWAQGDGARELEVMREEGKEKCQSDPTHSLSSLPLTLSDQYNHTYSGTLNLSPTPMLLQCLAAR